MEVKDEVIKISSSPVDDQGEHLEPEERPAARTQMTDIPVALGTGPAGTDTPIQGAVSGAISTQTTAGILASLFRNQCATCRYFDNRGMRAYIKILRSSVSGRLELNQIYSELIASRNAEFHDLHTGQDGDFDGDHALMSLGICRALSDISNGIHHDNDPVIVTPIGTCPTNFDDGKVLIRTPSNPDGCYRPRDEDAEKFGSRSFDSIMQTAQGKKG